MSVKLLSEGQDATITDEDDVRIDAILSFWFREAELSAPQIDRRMDTWFGQDPVFDHEIERDFGNEVVLASEGQLDHWRGRREGDWR
jgi:uncharacterized protein (DUF924 family)